jgi:cytochrome P450
MTDGDFTETHYNHHDPAFAQDPYAVFTEVRSKCPLGHSDQLGGFYFPTTYEGVKRVFSDFRTFTSTEGAGLPDQLVRLLPVDLDPPQHTRWRRVLNRFFTIEAANEDRPRIQRVADTLIDEFIERGTADAVNELTRPFLAMTMLPVLGVPIEDRKEIGEKLLWMVHNRLVDHDGWLKCYQEVDAYLTGLMANRRNTAPRNDLVQCLIDEEFDGRKLTDTEGYQVILLTLFGALDSTSSAMSGSLYHLARHPEDKQRLLSGEVAWEGALEEFIRFTTPIQALRRQVTQPTELDGSPLEPGVNVLALCGAANRDPAKFAEPDRCLIDRDAREHMSFGAGGHVCIGRHFARAMLETCLKTVLHRLPDFQVEPDFKPEYTPSEARALKTLPIVFTPGARLNAR